MRKQQRPVEDIRKRLLGELIQEVEDRFGGNKARAAEAVAMHRVPFTNLCNGKEGATIDKLIQIGAMLGWKIELRVDRGRERGS
jgi:plasmid maintenance system antidote protein VapI